MHGVGGAYHFIHFGKHGAGRQDAYRDMCEAATSEAYLIHDDMNSLLLAVDAKALCGNRHCLATAPRGDIWL